MKEIRLILGSILFASFIWLTLSIFKANEALDQIFFVEAQAQCDDDEREVEKDCPDGVHKLKYCKSGDTDCTPTTCPLPQQ